MSDRVKDLEELCRLREENRLLAAALEAVWLRVSRRTVVAWGFDELSLSRHEVVVRR